jgi:hypothetical protein
MDATTRFANVELVHPEGRKLQRLSSPGRRPLRPEPLWLNPALDRSQLTIAVAGIELSDRREGFVLLASFQNSLGRHSVEIFSPVRLRAVAEP